MAFANLFPIAASLNPVFKYSFANNGVIQAQEYSIVPKNQDGTIYDLTSLNSLAINCDNGRSDILALTGTLANSLITFDATGCVFSISAAAINALVATLGGGNGRITVTGFDGANNVLLASGNLQMQFLA